MGELRVLELFSGIGGMHYALKEAGTPFTVVAAVDISQVANQVYRHNFPSVRHLQRDICGLTPAYIRDTLQADTILMSPPCQPFTRQGKQRDTQDPRCKALLYITSEIIPKATSIKHVLVENVKGFETSEARNLLFRSLESEGFTVREFLLSPVQIGIPNSRLRYYLIASKEESGILAPLTKEGEISTSVDDFSNLDAGPHEPLKNIGEYLEKNVHEDYLLDAKTLLKFYKVMDVVTSSCSRSCCFTKSYGRYIEGTGSIVQQAEDCDISANLEAIRDDCHDTDNQRINLLKQLRLRYFSPREIANLMGFPKDSFSFPDDTTRLQSYRVLGNSLCVSVVALLIKIMLKERI